MRRPFTDKEIMEEVQRDMQRLRDNRKLAEEIVRDRGWSEKDEDFEFQIEQEAKRLWMEEDDQEMEEEEPWLDDLWLEEMTSAHAETPPGAGSKTDGGDSRTV